MQKQNIQQKERKKKRKERNQFIFLWKFMMNDDHFFHH